MSEDIVFIKDKNDYIEYSKLQPKKLNSRKKVMFICSCCHQEKIKTFRTLTLDFLCRNCQCKKSASNPETLVRRQETKLKLYGDPNYTNPEKRKNTNLEHFGVENVFQSEVIKHKAATTKIERYNDSHFTNIKKAEETNLVRYGKKCVFGVKFIREKAKQTKLERYGNENFVNHEKAKQTKLERYDDPYYANLEKRENTNLKKYGKKHVLQVDSIKKKGENTNLAKYGKKHYTQTEEFKNQYKNTCNKKYNKDNTFQVEEFKEKSRKTCLKNHGVEYPAQSKSIKARQEKTYIERYNGLGFASEKIREKAGLTNLKNYGTKYPSQTDKIKNKTKNHNKIKFNKEYYTQTDEYKIKINNTVLYKALKTNQNILSYENGQFSIKCPDCGQTYTISNSFYYNRINKGLPTCIHCLPLHKQYSFKEKRVLEYIKTIYDGPVVENVRQIINPFELDIYLPELNLAFEFDGTYWHADPRFFEASHIIGGGTNTAQDVWDKAARKDMACREKNITLYHIREYDWEENPELIKIELESILRNYYK